MKVKFDLNAGPLYGRPILPDDGNWETVGVGYAVQKQTGQWFTINDVAADGTVTLHPATDNWQNTLAPLGSTPPVPATPSLIPVAAAAAAANLPVVSPPAPGANLVPTKQDIAKYGPFAPATVPEGSPEAAS